MKTILLLRGLGREKAHWGSAIKNLESKGFKVVCIDLPGAGDQRHLISPLRVEDYVLFLQNQLESLGLTESFYLLGHSLGGMIALRWAFESPKQFKKVILVNTSDSHSKKIPERLSFFGLNKIFQIAKTKNVKQKENLVLQMISNNREAQNRAFEQWVSIASLRPISTHSILNQLIAASQFTAPNVIEVPLLYLTSSADKMVSYKCSEKLAKLHSAPIEIHNTAGHDLFLDDPSWVIEKISSHCS